MKLHDAQGKLAGGLENGFGGCVDEDADGGGEGADALKDCSSLFEGDVSSGGRVEDHADGIGAGVAGDAGIFGSADAADLDAKREHEGIVAGKCVGGENGMKPQVRGDVRQTFNDE